MAGRRVTAFSARVRSLRAAATDGRLWSHVKPRLALFLSCAGGATALDLAARALHNATGTHPLLRDWWLLAVLLAAALIVRPRWGAAVAGLAAGGALALSINGEMETAYGHGWSPGFVFAFTGAIGITMLLIAQMVGLAPGPRKAVADSSDGTGS